MIALIQRVNSASVSVDDEVCGEIGPGILAFIAVVPDDTPAKAARLAERVVTYRVFSDDDGRMNKSLQDQGLPLLAVPQFTLAADTRKGTRASFTRAAPPAQGRDLFEQFVVECNKRLCTVETGRFGAHMVVTLENDGPVTFWLEA
jgi:D-tyrosyl-tRNA(Tyr) deacylase